MELTDGIRVVCDPAADRLHVVDARQTAEPRPLTSVVLPPGTGPRCLVARRTGAEEWQLAVAGERDGRVTVVRHEGHDWANGWWVGASVLATRSPGASQPSAMAWFGHDLVVANRGTDTIALVRWNEDGSIALVSESPCGGTHPRELAEEGGLLFVTHDQDAVTALAYRGDGFEVVDPAR